MPARYDNPQDIAQLMHQTKRLQQSAERSPFTGLVTLFCYVLWKDYREELALKAKKRRLQGALECGKIQSNMTVCQ